MASPGSWTTSVTWRAARWSIGNPDDDDDDDDDDEEEEEDEFEDFEEEESEFEKKSGASSLPKRSNSR